MLEDVVVSLIIDVNVVFGEIWQQLDEFVVAACQDGDMFGACAVFDELSDLRGDARTLFGRRGVLADGDVGIVTPSVRG